MISEILISVVIGVIVCIISYWTIRFRKFKDINKLPGPSALESIWKTVAGGNLWDKYTYISNLNKKYGPVLKIWIKPFDPIIMVIDLEYVDKILMSKTHVDKSKLFGLMSPYIGNGIATTQNVNLWRKDRKICNLAFQHSTVTRFLPKFAKHTHKLFEILRNKKEEAVDIQPIIHFYTLDIIFESMLKEAHYFQENKDTKFLNARVEFFTILAERIFSVILKNDFLFSLSSRHDRTYKAADIMKNYTRNIINKQKIKNGNDEDSNVYLLDVLLASKMEEERLNDQINTFILAGHDTVGQAICFALYHISRNPDVQKRLYDEILAVVGQEKDAEIEYSNLQKMKYAEAVVKETLRLNTVVPMVERKISHDICINGINYPEGTVFMFQLNGVLNSERYFKNPSKFDPDRFMPENAHLIQKNSFLPFSAGPRDCIGKQFAMLEIVYSVAKIVQNFELTPVENHELKLVHEIAIVSKSGVPVIFKERKI